MNSGKLPRKPALVQSQIPTGFFIPKASAKPQVSPYFTGRGSSSSAPPAFQYPPRSTIPPAPPPKPPHLYPEHRAHLSHPPPTLSTTRSTLLAATASETKSLLPSLLASAPHAPATGHLYHPPNLPALASYNCPSLPPTRIRVVNTDTLDTALALSSKSPPGSPPVLILNMANAQHGGGGWLNGALAQEEALCYRTSLSFTLKRRYYPLPESGGIYSPSVLVLRQSLARGHALLDQISSPARLPVVSVISVAAVRAPELLGGQGESGRYRRATVREVMKEKMRVVLRIAATEGHRTLVLGALGCGAFGNPRGEVARCWKEVLREREFAGGWWEKVVFAVMEEGGLKDGGGNYGVFWRGLDGVEA